LEEVGEVWRRWGRFGGGGEGLEEVGGDVEEVAKK
jgi:hypothetical protein